MFDNVLLNCMTTPLSKKDEIHCWENRPFATIWPKTLNKSKDTPVTKTIKKKSKRVRTAYNSDQLRYLEAFFTENKYIKAECRKELADRLNVTDKSIKIWFQNRRMKEKRDSSDSNCDSSTESFPSASSPPLNHQPAPMIDKKTKISQNEAIQESLVNQYVNNCSEYSEVQYQFPNFNTDINFTTEYFNQPSFGVPFGYDKNVYPTQHYSSGAEFYHTGQYAQCVSENYWSPNSFEISYL